MSTHGNTVCAEEPDSPIIENSIEGTVVSRVWSGGYTEVETFANTLTPGRSYYGNCPLERTRLIHFAPTGGRLEATYALRIKESSRDTTDTTLPEDTSELDTVQITVENPKWSQALSQDEMTELRRKSGLWWSVTQQGVVYAQGPTGAAVPQDIIDEWKRQTRGSPSHIYHCPVERYTTYSYGKPGTIITSRTNIAQFATQEPGADTASKIFGVSPSVRGPVDPEAGGRKKTADRITWNGKFYARVVEYTTYPTVSRYGVNAGTFTSTLKPGGILWSGSWL